MTTAEEAVRNYLIALRTPELLQDEDRISDLSQKLADSDDPIERLRLRSELQRAKTLDTEQLEGDFVTHAKAWAAEHGVTAAGFKEEGVPREVLRKAGLAGGRRGASRSRARVSREDVAGAIPPRRKFTIADVAEQSGASPATVRNVVSAMLASGELEDLGAAPNYRGRGRAPTVYERPGK